MHHKTRFFNVHTVDSTTGTQFCIDINDETQFCKVYITYIISETQSDKTYTPNTIPVTQLRKTYTGYHPWAPIFPPAGNHRFWDPIWQNLHTEYHSYDPTPQSLHLISPMSPNIAPCRESSLLRPNLTKPTHRIPFVWPNSAKPILDITYGTQYCPLQGIIASETQSDKTYTPNPISVTQLRKPYTEYQLWATVLVLPGAETWFRSLVTVPTETSSLNKA
jgi:hypothetical protein